MTKPIRYQVIVAHNPAQERPGYCLGEFTNKETARLKTNKRLKGSGLRFCIWDSWERSAIAEGVVK